MCAFSQDSEVKAEDFEGDTNRPLPVMNFECMANSGKKGELFVEESFFSHQKVHVKPVMAEFYLKVRQASKLDVPVLLVGESGSGKNHTAKLIHKKSRKKTSDYFEININEINENLIESTLFGSVKGAFTGAEEKKGLFESASEGTLFLDEIGDFPCDLQTKLFGFLDTGSFRKIGSTKTLTSDARLMFATNANLYEKVREGKFRRELYYRISVFIIMVPPLREHKADIPEIAEEFASANGKKISKGALEKLSAHSWPGNVRELKNCILRACVYCDGDEILKKDIVFDHEIFGRFAGGL